MHRVLAALIWLALAVAFTAPARAADGFLDPGQAFQFSATQSAGASVRLHWVIAPGYYLYRDRIGIVATPAAPLQVKLPPGEPKSDPNFGTMVVYHGALTVDVPAAGARTLDVTWQGCAEAGLCYPPQRKTIQLAAAPGAGVVAAGPAPGSASPLSVPTSDAGITRLIGERSLIATLPLFFLLGIALVFTPCMLPMLPIVSGIVVGSRATPRRSFWLSLAFVLPMALTYAGLGMAAALAGANLQAALQNRWTILGLGALYVLLALGMFGLYTLQLPAALRERLDGANRRQTGGTAIGAAAMGVLSALLVGPCMTAPLAGTLVYIAQGGHVLEGGLLLLALGLGIGAPLLLVGTVGARLLPRPGVWMTRVNVAIGFLLLATAVWTVQRVVPEALTLALWGAVLIGLAVTLLHQSSSRRDGPPVVAGGRLLARTVAVLAGLWGSAMVLGAATGASDPWQPLAARSVSSAAPLRQATLSFETVASEPALQARLDVARAHGQVALVDFYADWCVSCKDIERQVFGDPRAAQALAGVVLLRADVTADDEAQRALLSAHGVVGPPTVLWFDAQGRERRDARLVGEFTLDDLLQRLTPTGDPVGARS